MTIWNAVSRALAGWMMILRSELDWRAQFSLTVPGLVTALVLFFFCAFVAIAMASISSAMPDVYGVLDLLLVHGIWITALYVAIRLTAMMLKVEVRTLDLLIPGIYLLIGYLLVGTLVNLIFAPIVQLVTLALIYPLYRLARAATTWNTGVSVAFAAATVLLLVAVPQALYMLSNVAL